ncbi:MAG TPA: alanine--glyoxylate aminotransferase family protein [Candidatus Korarchaeota archaeon]|nr:alanine--glyoxylate aminotransferase family protein [Candidatus Korarchaeota archaeon]
MPSGSPYINFIPGPVTPPERVMKALSEPMPYHRGEEFSELYERIMELLKPLFGGDGDVLVLTGSSTAGMEAMVSGFVRRRRVAVIVDGKFGERLRDIASLYGEVVSVEARWGTTPSIEELESSLSRVETLLVVHNETSTGVEHDMNAISDIAMDRGVELLVDVVSSIGGVEVKAERWGAKALAAGVQKCIGAPPGIAPVMIMRWEGYRSAPYYLDLTRYREAAGKMNRETPFTPALPLFRALKEALLEVHEEGLALRYERHRRISEKLRRGLEDMGVKLFADPGELGSYSCTVTSFIIDDPESVRRELLKRGIRVAGGQGPLRGKILRAATMANVRERDVEALLFELENVLHST